MHGNFQSPGEDPQAGSFDPACKIHVTFFKDFAANTYTTENLTLAELRERVLNAAAREKGKLPAEVGEVRQQAQRKG